MSNKPKRIGTSGETAVVRFLAANGFPNAERRALRGSLDCGDITGCHGLCIEVKSGAVAETASDGQIAAWITETEIERHNANATHGLLITKRRGKGPDNAGQWWVHIPGHTFIQLATAGTVWEYEWQPTLRLTLADAVLLLRHAGYGARLRKGEVA